MKFCPKRKFLPHWAEPFRWRFCGLSADSDAGERGRYGEWVACRYLVKQGYLPLVSNWRNPADRRDEIDLICKDREVLVFVEVRARRATSLVSGYDSLSPRKRKVLLKVCKAYLNQRKQRPDHFRFDVVEVDLQVDGKAKTEVFHHENIALFPPRYH